MSSCLKCPNSWRRCKQPWMQAAASLLAAAQPLLPMDSKVVKATMRKRRPSAKQGLGMTAERKDDIIWLKGQFFRRSIAMEERVPRIKNLSTDM